MPNIVTSPLAGHQIRLFFTARGQQRFFLSDALEAFELGPKTAGALKLIRKAHIRPLSRKDATETVSRIGLIMLALNSRSVGPLTYNSFLCMLPRQAPSAAVLESRDPGTGQA